MYHNPVGFFTVENLHKFLLPRISLEFSSRHNYCCLSVECRTPILGLGYFCWSRNSTLFDHLSPSHFQWATCPPSTNRFHQGRSMHMSVFGDFGDLILVLTVRINSFNDIGDWSEHWGEQVCDGWHLEVYCLCRCLHRQILAAVHPDVQLQG